MSEIVYAVHTRACTYLLDEDGFCKWVLSRSGAKSDDRCVGAQFVAALDLRSKGGLVGELRIGAQALFIRHEEGRFALIRTKPIEHVEIRGAEGEMTAEGGEDEEQVVLPDQLAVAAVFDAPAPAPEPPPPSARVILQSPGHRTEPPPPIAAPITAPLPEPTLPPIPAPLPPRTYAQPAPRAPSAPPYVAPSPSPRWGHDPAELPRVPEPPLPAYAEPPPRAATPLPPPPVAARKFPEPPPRNVGSSSSSGGPRARPSQPRRDPSQETQPLPPAGPVPAWPPMLAPPPPQAEMMPLGPARPALPSAEELDVDDLEEVGDDDQIYSMEVTLTLPLFRGEPHGSAAPRGPGETRPLPGHLFRR